VVIAIVRDRDALYQALELPLTDGLIILGLLVGYFVLYAQRFVLLIEKHCRCRLGLFLLHVIEGFGLALAPLPRQD
jgi:hypothetical protein